MSNIQTIVGVVVIAALSILAVVLMFFLPPKDSRVCNVIAQIGTVVEHKLVKNGMDQPKQYLLLEPITACMALNDLVRVRTANGYSDIVIVGEVEIK